MMTGLLIFSFIMFWGGGPDRDRLGFRYWKNPGAANTYLVESDPNTGRFLALLSTLVLSAFPFTFAPEYVRHAPKTEVIANIAQTPCGHWW